MTFASHSISPSSSPILPLSVNPGSYSISAADVLAAASAYVAAGLSVLPIARNGSKTPEWRLLPVIYDENSGQTRHPWKPYQSRHPSQAELVEWFGNNWPVYGVAVIAGMVSGGLEILDFDSFDAVEPWANLVRQQNAQLLDQLVIVQTPRPGLHVYYRCPAAARTQKLAQRIEPDAQQQSPTVKTLIETKAEGGYALVPPSPLDCHPSRRPYLYRSVHCLSAIPTISIEDRNLLIDAARSFDETPPSMRLASPLPAPGPRRPPNPALPGGDFEIRANWHKLLRKHGWTYVSGDGDGMERWCRPGKSGETSATLNHAGTGLFHNFSSSVAGLDANKSYSKLSFLVAVEFGGDFEAAKQYLQQQGYGQQRSAWVSRRRQQRHRRTR